MNKKERVAELNPENKKENRSSRTKKDDFQQSSGSLADRVLFLQNTIGNQGVGRIIRSGALQAKISVNEAGDIYEQEADRIAEHIASMPAQQTQPVTQRQIPKEEDKKPVHMKIDRASEADNGVSSQAEDMVAAASTSEGQPLPPTLQNKFENALGVDLSPVRVHTGPQSVAAAQAVSARAYTMNSDIHFNEGEYNPDSAEGQNLLAHEMTHVVQQGGGQGLSRRLIQRRGTPIPNGVMPYPSPTNSVDGSKVVTKLNEMGAAIFPTRGSFDGFNGTPVERQTINAFETSNLQPRSIAINWLDERGLNKVWTGTVNIRMENPTPVQGTGGSGTGKVTAGGGGTGTSGTTTSSGNTTGGSAEVSGGGHEGAVGGKVGGEASTTTSQGESQGASGSATTGAETTSRIQLYECTIIADIFLKCELDVSGIDYVNPFKWGTYIGEGISGSHQMSDSVDCGRWTYQASSGLAPTPPPTPGGG